MSEVLSYEQMMALFQETHKLMRESELRLEREMEKREKAETARRTKEEAARKKKEAQEEARRAKEEAVRRAEEVARRAEEEAAREKDAAEDKARREEINQQLKELGKQIGGLGNKWGVYTEGLAFPSLSKTLREKFGMTVVVRNALSKKGNRNMEIDVLGYANGDINRVCVVEVKGELKEEAIVQVEKIVRNFGEFFPEHKGKELVVILAAVKVSEEMAEKVIEKGFYVASTADEVFRLLVPADYCPPRRIVE